MSSSVPSSQRLPVQAAQPDYGRGLPLVLKLEQAPVLTILSVSGELDVAGAPLLDQAVARATADTPDEVLVDLSGLSFLDSSGIRALLRAIDTCERCGCRAVFLRGSRQAQQILSCAQVLDRFVFAD